VRRLLLIVAWALAATAWGCLGGQTGQPDSGSCACSKSCPCAPSSGGTDGAGGEGAGGEGAGGEGVGGEGAGGEGTGGER
jgi:hypothetical protein